MLQTLTRVEAIAAGLGATVSLGAWTLVGIDLACGVFVGALLALANFHVMRKLMAKMILDDRSAAGRGALAAVGGAKLLLLIVLVGVVITTLKVDPWGFFFGTLTLVVAIVAGALTSDFGRPVEEV